MLTTRPTRPTLAVRRVRRAVRLACGVAGWLTAQTVGPTGMAPAAAAGSQGTPTVSAPVAPSLEALVAQATRQKDELRRLEGELQAARKAQAQGEREAAQRAQAIEQLKSEAAGVTRDLRLQELLAQAQAQAVVLSQKAGELRSREAALSGGRERLVRTCDQVLAADGGGKLALAERLGWLRLRTTQIEALHGAADRDFAGQAVRTVVQAGAALGPEGGAEVTGSDDPQVLRERADLLRDSADKLHREVVRLKGRADELGHRQRLRERAARVDEDLFAEQTTSRHRSSRSGAADSTLQAAPTAPTVAGVPSPMPQSPQGTVSFDSGGGSGGGARITLDPSTLDVLQRAESLTDPVAKLQALQRAQAELGTLTEQLLSRAARLERRADELGRKK